MNPWLALVLVGLGTMKVVELLKEIFPWILRPWAKSALSLAVAGILSVLVGGDLTFTEIVLLTYGGAGLAALCHELRDFLSASGDIAKSTVIARATGRSRQRI